VAENSPQDFGGVPTNVPATASVYLLSDGGITDVTGVTVATTSGTGHFTANNTTCEYFLLYKEFDNGNCAVSITATSVDPSGVTNGTVTFHTGTGDVVDDLTFTGAPPVVPPAAPTHVAGTTKSHEVDLSWDLTPTASDGGQPIEYYEIDASADGGKTWSVFDDDYDTTDDPATVSETFGVDNNTTYEFRVLANNGFANSDPSSPVTLTPEGPATSIAAPSTSTIVWSKSAMLTTAVTSLGQPVGGVSVLLQKKASGATAWTTADSTNTETNGSISLKVTPTRSTAYRWMFTGNDSYAPSTSGAATVNVAQLVTAKLGVSKVKRGKPVKIFGTVSPTAKGQRVTVAVKSGHRWKAVGTPKLIVQKLPNGKKALGFVFSYKPPKKGTQTLRVTKSATPTNAAGTSSSLTLKVT
jgi:5-hydroxyisourate hydrolase-like protein (transthyretin family)